MRKLIALRSGVVAAALLALLFVPVVYSVLRNAPRVVEPEE